MSNRKYSESDPERTLITLDQLSQTIEVMTSVVNRLRQHLSEQVAARKAQEQREKRKQERKALRAKQSELKQQEASEAPPSEAVSCPASSENRTETDSFVVEITQPEAESQPKSTKILH